MYLPPKPGAENEKNSPVKAVTSVAKGLNDFFQGLSKM
jgi:hypothetical protein